MPLFAIVAEHDAPPVEGAGARDEDFDALPVTRIDGYVKPHDTPGIGMELRPKMLAEMRTHLQLP